MPSRVPVASRPTLEQAQVGPRQYLRGV